ncbi:MAG: hypothetical protein ACLRWF_05710 [Ruthenibacterium sp.]
MVLNETGWTASAGRCEAHPLYVFTHWLEALREKRARTLGRGRILEPGCRPDALPGQRGKPYACLTPLHFNLMRFVQRRQF